jgi:integrase
MPWRKYQPKQGKYGPTYLVDRGVSVRKDARGKWTLFIEKQRVRKNKTFGPGRDELTRAIKAAEQWVQTVGSVSMPSNGAAQDHPSKPPFIDYSKQWLKDNAGRWQDDTLRRYGEILRLHIWPYSCYGKPLDKVHRNEIKKHLRNILDKRSPNTVESIHAVISGIFNEAIDDDLVSANPATGLLKRILPPTQNRDLKDADPFNREDRDHFIDHSTNCASWAEQLILKVMAFAGLRLGEALAMRIEHFKPNKRQYYVAQGYRQKRFKKPKSGKMRYVDLPEFLVDELKAYIAHLKKQCLQAGKGKRVDLLFVDPAENGPWPYSQRKIQGLVKKVCKKADLRIRNPHDLRHTYATILLMAHQSPAYVQKQLGHSSISITVDTYGHWVPGEGRNGLEAALLGDDLVPNRVRKPHIIAYKRKGPQ